MCCGIFCALWGVGAYFTTALLAHTLLGPDQLACSASGSDTFADAEAASGWLSGAKQLAAALTGAAAPGHQQLLALPRSSALTALAAVSGPALLLEHVLFLSLAAFLAGRAALAAARRAAGAAAAAPDCAAAAAPQPLAALTRLQALSDQIRSLGGPEAVLAWDEVAPAPPASMDVESLGDGEVVAHRDGRGEIYRWGFVCLCVIAWELCLLCKCGT